MHLGFTHYWERPLELPEKEWALFTDDVRKVLDACARKSIAIGDGMGEGRPFTVDAAEVWLNGVKANSHETFFVERVFANVPAKKSEPLFGFCKTARKPYDLAVTACLILARHHFGRHFVVTSDGSDSDWQAARDLLLAHDWGRAILDSADTYHFAVLAEGGKRVLTVIDDKNLDEEKCEDDDAGYAHDGGDQK
jgi:hypothetical protein